MEFLIIAIVIIAGFVIFLFTIGHLLLVVKVALPITRVLVMFEVLRPFRTRTSKRDIIFDSYFLMPLFGFLSIITLITIGFFFFISSLFQYLIIGYILGGLTIVFNWLVRKTYSINKNSFQNWYLNNHRQHIDFDVLQKMNIEDEDKLFDVIATWITPEAQNKIKGMMKK